MSIETGKPRPAESSLVDDPLPVASAATARALDRAERPDTDTLRAIAGDWDAIAWVPCITGRLFFRHAVAGLGHTFLELNYVAERQGVRMRDVVVASRVDWQDIHVDETGRPTTGIYRVCLTTRFASGSEAIFGEVTLLPVSAVGDLHRHVDALLETLRRRAMAGEGVAAVFDELRDTLRRLSPIDRRCAQKVVEFRLDRTGCVMLRLRAGAHYDAETRFVALRQAFYFVKNIWHVHKHHDRWDESLTTVHPLGRDLDVVAAELLDDMKSAVTAAHRDAHRFDREGIGRARGILAYARSLTTTLAEHGLLSRRTLHRETRYLDNLAESLSVTDQTYRRQIDERHHAHDRFRNFVLFVLATMAPVTLMYRDAVLAGIAERGGLGDHLLVRLFALFFGSAYGVVGGLVLIFGAYGTYAWVVGRRGRHYLARRRVVRWWIDTIAPHPFYGRLAAAAIGAVAMALAIAAVVVLLAGPTAGRAAV